MTNRVCIFLFFFSFTLSRSDFFFSDNSSRRGESPFAFGDRINRAASTSRFLGRSHASNRGAIVTCVYVCICVRFTSIIRFFCTFIIQSQHLHVSLG